MARNVTLSRNSDYKNGAKQLTDTFLAVKLNEGVKLESVFDTLIGVNPSHEYVEHDGSGAIIGWSLKEAWYDENLRAGIILTAGNKDTYFEKNYRGDSSSSSSTSIPLIQKGQAGGVATLDNNGKVPLSELEIVQFINAEGVINTKDGNSDVKAVANWSNLQNKTALVDNDRFYIADPAVPNGQNKLASFGDIKTQIKTDLLTGVVLKDPLTGLVPTNLIEVVKYDTTDGTVVTSDANSVTRAIADSTQLAKATVNNLTDEFYFKNNTTGKNETITFANLKKELSSVCFKLASQDLTPNVTVKFPHTFGTKDLSSVTVYDSLGNVITNEVNFDTKVTATDIEVKCTVAVTGVYVIACGLDNGLGGVTPPPAGATTVTMTATGYKVITTVNNVVSNEIELPCPIVGEVTLNTVDKTKTDFSANQGWFELGNNNPSFILNTPAVPVAPAGYNWYIDLNFRVSINDRIAIYPNARYSCQLRTKGANFDHFSNTIETNQKSVNDVQNSTIQVFGGKLTSGINTITTRTYYENNSQQATPAQDFCRFDNPKYNYKIYLAKSTF
jgi:hypothetical protein